MLRFSFYGSTRTARVCDLPDRQTGEGHGRQERVRAVAGQREGRVMHVSPRQHQSVVEQEEAQIAHLLVGPAHMHAQDTQCDNQL